MATGGFKLSLVGAKGKPGLKAPLPAKRKRLALDDDEPEDTNAKQEITGWDIAEGGAVDANAKKEEPKAPRVIPVEPNRNWREEALKRQLGRGGVPPTGSGENEEHREQPKMAFGLVTFDKKDAEEGDAKPEPMEVDGEAKTEDTRTEEEKLQAEAFEALVNGKSTNQTVIPISEEEAMKNDIRDAPDAPTLAVYEATPIEGFGAALLRGMGWKDNDTQGKDKKKVPPEEVKRRPALLGIGAKPESAVGLELNEFNGGKKGQKAPRKAAMQYAPVTLRNKNTGELVTEDQLKERLQKQKEADEKKARNNTFVGDDDAEDDRRREKRRDRRGDDYEKDRRRDRRDDDYEKERRRDKDRREDKYSDRDHRRDKKYREDDYDDRRRDKYRDKDSRRERSRSPRDEDRRRKHRERDRRERSVDSSDHRRDKRERRDRDRSRSRDSDYRRKRRRENDYKDERDDRRSKHRDEKY